MNPDVILYYYQKQTNFTCHPKGCIEKKGDLKNNLEQKEKTGVQIVSRRELNRPDRMNTETMDRF